MVSPGSPVASPTGSPSIETRRAREPCGFFDARSAARGPRAGRSRIRPTPQARAVPGAGLDQRREHRIGFECVEDGQGLGSQVEQASRASDDRWKRIANRGKLTITCKAVLAGGLRHVNRSDVPADLDRLSHRHSASPIPAPQWPGWPGTAAWPPNRTGDGRADSSEIPETGVDVLARRRSWLGGRPYKRWKVSLKRRRLPKPLRETRYPSCCSCV